MDKKKIKALLSIMIILFIVIILLILSPLENTKTIAGIIILRFTNEQLVEHPIYKNTFIVATKIKGYKSGFDYFIDFMQREGYSLTERFGAIWCFEKNGKKLILTSRYKSHRLLKQAYIIFQP